MKRMGNKTYEGTRCQHYLPRYRTQQFWENCSSDQNWERVLLPTEGKKLKYQKGLNKKSFGAEDYFYEPEEHNITEFNALENFYQPFECSAAQKLPTIISKIKGREKTEAPLNPLSDEDVDWLKDYVFHAYKRCYYISNYLKRNSGEQEYVQEMMHCYYKPKNNFGLNICVVPQGKEKLWFNDIGITIIPPKSRTQNIEGIKFIILTPNIAAVVTPKNIFASSLENQIISLSDSQIDIINEHSFVNSNKAIYIPRESEEKIREYCTKYRKPLTQQQRASS